MNDIQKAILEIFIEVKRICDNNNIRYFAIGGTCLGAVRHHGFVPWDDDLDIAIPIDDYYRFLESAKAELPDHLELFTCDTVHHYRYIFAKVTDTRTTFIERADYPYPDAYKGIFVDIKPISGVPAKGLKRKVFINKIFWYTTLNRELRFPLKEYKSWKSKILWFFVHPLNLFLPYNYFSNKHLALLRRHSFDHSEYTGYVWSLNLNKLTFPKQWFNKTTPIPFETATMSCPQNWAGYLSAHFNDYMKLPPKEAQLGHHYGIIKTDTPFDAFKKTGITDSNQLHERRLDD